MSYNRVTLIGHVGADPEIREANGGKFATLRLATTDKGYIRKSDGAQIPEQTQWHSLVVNGGLVQVIENFVHRGSKIFITGKLKYREYQANDGSKRWATEISVYELELLDPKQQQPNPAPQPMSTQQQYETVYGAPDTNPLPY